MSENKAGTTDHSAAQVAAKNVSGGEDGVDSLETGHKPDAASDSVDANKSLEMAGDRMRPDAAREVLVNDNEDSLDDTRKDADTSAGAMHGDERENNDHDSDAAAASEPHPGVAALVGPKPPGRGLAWLALLIALLGVGASAYLGWILWQERNAARELVSLGETNQAQINKFQRAITDVEKRVENERNARSVEAKALRDQLAKANTLIEGQSRRLLSLTATTTDDWRLAEVEYLLRLANQRILTSKDGRTALNLLNAADDILVELGDPRFYSVREAIANDRAALSLVGQADLDGVFLQLAALAAQIDKLPLLSVPDFSMRAAAAQPDADAITVVEDTGLAGRFGEIARSTWAELKSLVVIQRRDASVKPLLPPEQQYYLRNNLRLLINQAQIALLDGRQAPYRESLVSAVGWLEEYFPMQEAANRAVAETLAELSNVVISAKYPDVSASLLAIKAFIAEQHRLGESGKKNNGNASAGAKP